MARTITKPVQKRGRDANKLVEEVYFDDELYQGDEIPNQAFLEAAAGFDVQLLFHPRSKWPVEKKIEVAATYIQRPGSIIVSKLTGVPASTIREWSRKAIWWDDTIEKCKLALNEAIAASLSRALSVGAEKLCQQIEHGINIHVETQEWEEVNDELPSGPDGNPCVVKRKRKIYETMPISGPSLAATIGIVYDKLALAHNRPTQITRNESDEENIVKRIEDSLSKAYATKMANEDNTILTIEKDLDDNADS